MRGNPPMQHRQNMGWQATFSVILSMLAAIQLFLSTASFAQQQTFVLGENQRNYELSGPTRDGSSVHTYPTGRTVYFSRSAELAPANVTINWNGSHGGASYNNGVFCNVSDQGTGNPLSIESGLVSAGSYGGVDIFKTNVPGLYFSLALRSFNSYTLSTSTTTSPIQIQNGIIHKVITLKDTDGCYAPGGTSAANEYYTMGGLSFYLAITFYTDQTYTPTSSQISLLKSGSYHVRIWNEDPGPGINSFYNNVTIDISAVTIAEPTCTTQPVASGSSVSGTTVNLGSYSPNDIINGAPAVPFAIKLAGCKGLRNINVTLSSTTVASDTTLLGNILSLNHATGVGLEIRGAANSYSTETLMIPNENSSVYNDQRDTSSDDNIYGTSENGKVQTHTLNFLATLKHDSSQKIGSGNFKANGIFTLDYP